MAKPHQPKSPPPAFVGTSRLGNGERTINFRTPGPPRMIYKYAGDNALIATMVRWAGRSPGKALKLAKAKLSLYDREMLCPICGSPAREGARHCSGMGHELPPWPAARTPSERSGGALPSGYAVEHVGGRWEATSPDGRVLGVDFATRGAAVAACVADAGRGGRRGGKGHGPGYVVLAPEWRPPWPKGTRLRYGYSNEGVVVGTVLGGYRDEPGLVKIKDDVTGEVRAVREDAVLGSAPRGGKGRRAKLVATLIHVKPSKRGRMAFLSLSRPVAYRETYDGAPLERAEHVVVSESASFDPETHEPIIVETAIFPAYPDGRIASGRMLKQYRNLIDWRRAVERAGWELIEAAGNGGKLRAGHARPAPGYHVVSQAGAWDAQSPSGRRGKPCATRAEAVAWTWQDHAALPAARAGSRGGKARTAAATCPGCGGGGGCAWCAGKGCFQCAGTGLCTYCGGVGARRRGGKARYAVHYDAKHTGEPHVQAADSKWHAQQWARILREGGHYVRAVQPVGARVDALARAVKKLTR